MITSSESKILNVDDYASSRDAITGVLQKSGFDVREAETGEEALLLAASYQPQLILLDVELPDVDGYEVCRRLKADPATASIAVLLISGVYNEGEDKVRGLETGADGYLVKPVQSAELIATINALLRMRRAEQSVRSSEALKDAVLNALPAQIAVIDEEGTIVAVNKAWQACQANQRFAAENGAPEATTGVGFNYLNPGRRTSQAGGEAAEPGLIIDEGIKSVLKGARDSFTIEYPCHAPAEERWWMMTVTPLPGGRKGAVIARTNITERRLWEEERERLYHSEQQARARAEEMGRLKDHFLATVSHELRAPLNSIQGWAKLLGDGRLNEEEASRAIKIIERSARAQNRIINDLLDVSRIITGKLRLNVQPLQPARVIEAAIESLRPAAEAKSIRIVQALDAGAGLISGDADRLQQLVWNLLSNAIKFTPKGGRAEVRLERVDSNVEIVVSDTGMGIDPEFIPFVFDRFRQADSSSTRRHGGLGLGLAIVRHLAEIHGGSVRAESSGAGQGASFIVRLPRLIAQDAAGGFERQPTAPIASFAAGKNEAAFECPPLLKNLRVLVVDDDADARELVGAILMQCGLDVRTAASAGAALSILSNRQGWQPEVLISDIEMPEQDGYSLIRAIRAMELAQGSRLPAIALTAYTRMEDRLRALGAGFQMHLAKPVEAAELMTVVASLTGRIVESKVA